jgi:hypothetical protein
MYGESTGAYRVLVGKPEGRNHLKDGRIIIYGSSGSGMGELTGLIWLRIGTGCGHL